MREYNIRTSPVKFLSIEELQIDSEINQHGRMLISGYIADEEEEEYLKLLTGEVWEQAEEVGKDGETEVLFTGLVTDFSLMLMNDQKKLTLEIMTGSYLLDEKKHLRSYQNPSVTYEQIFKEMIDGYKESGVIFAKPYQEKTENLVLQYQETDWQFLKRLASRKNQYLVPESRVKGRKIFYALPEGEEFQIPEGYKCTMGKNLSEYREKVSRGMGISEADCLVYMAECREQHKIGDYVMLFGRKFYVYKVRSRYENGELLHNCYMKREKGIEVPEVWQEKMTGCSLSAKVTKVKEDKVQVSVQEDENREQDINIWYPYATVYSTPDGTGWYCMPEPEIWCG